MNRLPASSHFRQEQSGEPVWPLTDQLLNLLILVQRLSAWDGKGERPELFPMGPAKPKAAPRVDPERMRAELAKWRDGIMPDFS